MNMARPLLVCLTLASISLAASQDRSDSIMGFSAADAARQRALESKFLVLPSAEKAREWHREFTREPHPAASAENNRLADFVAAQWRAQGWENVTLRRYEVLHSAPRSVSLEMVEPSSYRATLRKTAGLDAISKLQRDSLNRALLQVESNFLDVLGVSVLLGHNFTADEDRKGAPPVVILSHDVWQRRFGGDPQAVGRMLEIDGKPVRIAGVLPPSFESPLGEPDLILPQQARPEAVERADPDAIAGYERLDALPHARYCIDCKQREEDAKK